MYKPRLRIGCSGTVGGVIGAKATRSLLEVLDALWEADDVVDGMASEEDLVLVLGACDS